MSTTPTSWTGPELTAQQRVGALVAGLSAANDAAEKALAGEGRHRHQAGRPQVGDLFLCLSAESILTVARALAANRPSPRHYRPCEKCYDRGLITDSIFGPRHASTTTRNCDCGAAAPVAMNLPVAAGSSFPAPGETATAGTSSRPVVAAELPTVLRSVGTGAASNLGDGLDAALTNEAQR